MQRPDKDIIRRILTQAKKATLPRPDSFKNTKKNVEVALTLPLISLTDDFFNSSPIIDWYYDDFLTQGGRDQRINKTPTQIARSIPATTAAALISSCPIRSLILHERRDVGGEACHKDEGGGVFYYLLFDRSLFAVLVALVAEGVVDGHPASVADVAVSH